MAPINKIHRQLDRRNIISSEPKAKQWLLDKIRNIGKHGVTDFTPGKMFMYFYDPKGKSTLPYYDKFPLTIIVDRHSDGFTGLNLHYLPPTMRALLLDKLMALATNKKYDETTRLKISYNILNDAARYAAFRPCFKKYLWKHLKSKFVPIDVGEWDIAIFLPTAQFQKASAGTVWKESKEMIS